MKILLLNPPFKTEHGRFSREQRSPAITKGGTLYYPMWLSYAAGVLEENGFDIYLLDAPATGLSEKAVIHLAQAYKPDLAVIDTSTPSIMSDAGIASLIREKTGAFTILVGTHPTAMPEETLSFEKTADAVARGEYEETLVELAAEIKKHQGNIPWEMLEGIQGISFQKDGKVVSTPPRPLIEDLDSLPFLSGVYRKHLDIRGYFYTIAQYPQVAIFSGRGCPHRCGYCVYPQVMHGHRYRKRSIENLISEFQYVEKELPEVREIFIEDDTFTIDKKRVLEFSDAYRKAGLSISWIANSRADVDLETLVALKKANLRLLCVGFESGDQKILDAMNKRLCVEDARKFSKNAKKAGILVHGCFLAGNPGETKETLEKTLSYAKELNPDTAQFFPIMVYPGTKAFSWAKENNYLLSEDFSLWNTETGLHNCMVSRPGLTNRELVAFCDRARKEFYLRPKYLAYRVKRLITHPVEDGPRMLKSFGVFKKFLFPAAL